MPRKPQQSPIVCQNFVWRLLLRDGVYYADGRGGKFDLGKHSLGTRDKHIALDGLKELDRQKAIELGLIGAEPKATGDAISISHGWKLYLDYCARTPVMGGTSESTRKRYRPVNDKHAAFCSRHGVQSWNEFDVSMLEKYGNFLSKNKGDRTIYLELTVLKQVNGWLIENKHLPDSCRLVYSLVKPQGTDTYCWAVAEVDAMLAFCRTAQRLGWLSDVIVGLAHTGTRIGELAGLRWTDVDLIHDVLRVADERASRRKREAGTARTTKGKRSRTIPIHPRLRKLLLSLPRKPDGLVFHAAQGGRLRSRNVLAQFIKHVIEPLKKKFPTPDGEIGFEHGRLHSFRHYFCSQAFLGGASEGEIKSWLGHQDSRMVEHYRHLRNDDAQRKMGKINFLGDEHGPEEASA